MPGAGPAFLCPMNVFREFDKENGADVLKDYIRNSYAQTIADLRHFMTVEFELSDARLDLAVTAYLAEIRRFAEYLSSADPDHYKRCGALLCALCKNPVLPDVQAEYSSDDVRTGFSRVTHDASEDIADLMEFCEEFHDYFLAFNMCLRLCEMYEGKAKPLTFEDIHTICHYLKNNSLPPDAYYMLFRLLMT